MLLSFTSIDQQANFRECSWWFNTLEAAFDALNAISAKGNQIISAEITDNDERTVLPVEVFDGYAFSPIIKGLENEWQQVLSMPVSQQSARTEYWEKAERK